MFVFFWCFGFKIGEPAFFVVGGVVFYLRNIEIKCPKRWPVVAPRQHRNKQNIRPVLCSKMKREKKTHAENVCEWANKRPKYYDNGASNVIVFSKSIFVGALHLNACVFCVCGYGRVRANIHTYL